MEKSPKLAISVVLWNQNDQVLLIKRAYPPYKGKWTLPGGKVKWQETLLEACHRELWEETKLTAEIKWLGEISEVLIEDHHFVILPYVGYHPQGVLSPNSEIEQAAFFNKEDLSFLETTPRLEEIIQKAANLELPFSRFVFSSPPKLP